MNLGTIKKNSLIQLYRTIVAMNIISSETVSENDIELLIVKSIIWKASRICVAAGHMTIRTTYIYIYSHVVVQLIFMVYE